MKDVVTTGSDRGIRRFFKSLFKKKNHFEKHTNHKVLVTYFSASGVTKNIANKIATLTNGDLFEIVPETKYTKEDLDWTNKQSRSSLEMANKKSRPQIAYKRDNLNEYDTIFVGFPIWWYREPSIIDTFMESYDFTNKTIIPFATSGGSELGDSSKNLQILARTSKVLKGKKIDKNASNKELTNWLKEVL